MKERLQRLLCVKSIVTVLLTVFFCILSARGWVSAQEFITIFTVVISFYFGTQHERWASPRRLSYAQNLPTCHCEERSDVAIRSSLSQAALATQALQSQESRK